MEKLFQNKEPKITIPKEMNACLFYGPKDIRCEKVPTPQINDNEILVKINTALTCGTDLKTFKRGHPVLIKSIPSTFGHQFSGIVTKVGKNIKNFHEGQRVVSLNTAPCYKCRFCKMEKLNLCENLEFVNGAYAEYIAVPERIVKYNTYEIPDSMSFETAALLESLAVVTHGFERSEITKDKTVCIIGSGSIGLLFSALAKYKNVKVILIGKNPYKLNVAKDLGISHIINMTEVSNEKDLVEKLKHLGNGEFPEVVVEAVGMPESWELAIKIVSKGGVINFFGGCEKGTKIQIDTYRLHYEELNLIGVFHHTPKHVKEALNLLTSEYFSKSVIPKIITGSFPLNKLEEVFHMHESGEIIQAAIKP